MRDDFQDKVLRELASRAGCRCSNPDCRRPTSGPKAETSGFVNIGVGAHITAAAANGPRYNPALHSDQRSASENGIWLCQSCSSLIDRDPNKYTNEILLNWKVGAEFRAKSLIESPDLPTGKNEPMLSVPETDLDASWLAFSAQATKFLGREMEKVALERFLGSPSKFAWWLVTGSAGTGKSRLALECCRQKLPLWYAGFLSRTEQFKEWTRFRPTRPTLIVLDYVASRAEAVGEIILQLARSSALLPFPVRVLLVERDRGAWWSDILRDSSQSESAEIRAYLFDEKDLHLNGFTSEQLSALAQDIFQSIGKPWTPLIEREFKYRMHTVDTLSRPLFGIMVALHLAMGAVDVNLSASLLCEVLSKESGRRRAAVSDSANLRKLENLIVLATLVGGLLPQRGAFEFLARTSAVSFLPDMSFLDFKLYRDLVSAPSNESCLAGLQPDILGERFVLNKIVCCDPFDNSFKHLLAAAWALQGAGLCDFIVRATSDFPEDTALNTLCDLPLDSPETRVRWGRLVAELVRVRGKSDSPLTQPLLSKLRRLVDSYANESGLREECARAELYLGNIFMFIDGNAEAALVQFGATIICGGKASDMAASAINNRGILHSQMRVAEKAFEDWTNVIESKGVPDEIRACSFNNRADVFADRGEHEKAIADRSSVLALKETSADRRYIALFRRSRSYLLTNQSEKALEDLAALLSTSDIAPEQKAEALVERGRIYTSLDKCEKAQQDFGEVLAFEELFPGTLEKALVGLAELTRLDGDTERAGEYLRDALESHDIRGDTFVDGLILTARLLAQAGKNKDAESLWQTISTDPRTTLEQLSIAKSQGVLSKKSV